MKSKTKYILTILVVMVLASLVMAMGVQPALAATSAVTNCKQWHTVKSGDYLSSIARQYNVDWRDIAKINNLTSPYVIHPGQQLCVSVSGTPSTPPPATPPPSSGAVRVYATQVWEDRQVSLQGKSLVANSTYTVYLSNFKGNSSGLIKVGTVKADKNGAFTKVYNIPGKLADVPKVKVRLDNGKKDVAENWFINGNVSGNTGGYGAPALTMSLVNIKPNKSVKVNINNIPANLFFRVYIGRNGATLDKMTLVDRVQSPQGKNLKVEFAIPAAYNNIANLEVRLVNSPVEMYARLPFANKK